MGDRYITAQVQTYSSGTPGRALCSARTNHFVADDLAAHGGPGEALNAAELFLSLGYYRLCRPDGGTAGTGVRPPP